MLIVVIALVVFVASSWMWMDVAGDGSCIVVLWFVIVFFSSRAQRSTEPSIPWG